MMPLSGGTAINQDCTPQGTSSEASQVINLRASRAGRVMCLKTDLCETKDDVGAPMVTEDPRYPAAGFHPRSSVPSIRSTSPLVSAEVARLLNGEVIGKRGESPTGCGLCRAGMQGRNMRHARRSSSSSTGPTPHMLPCQINRAGRCGRIIAAQRPLDRHQSTYQHRWRRSCRAMYPA